MGVALADVQAQRSTSLGEDGKIKMIGALIVHECPLFRMSLRSLLRQQEDCHLVGETTQPEEVLSLAREHRPIVLLDGSLTSALEIVQQLRQVGVQGIMVFAPEMGDEETLFRFLQYGAAAYVDPYLSGGELLTQMRRVALGECLFSDDVLFAQAARRERLARIRQEICKELQAHLTRVCLSSPPGGDCNISEQERAVLEQIARGGTNAQVAQALGIRHHTVKNQLHQLYHRLHVRDRTAAVVVAMRNHWIAVED